LFDPVNPDVDNEVDLYLTDTSTKLSRLKKYPTLKQLFLKYKAALPSSASVEVFVCSAWLEGSLYH
jgi:hypothetical protein